MKRNLIYACMGAVVLSAIDSIINIAPYLDIVYLEYLCFLVGTITCVLTLSYRIKSCKDLLIRQGFLLIFHIAFFLIGSYIGTMQIYEKIFNISHYDPSNNAAGLLMLIFWILMSIVSAVTIAINAFRLILLKRKI